MTTLFPSTSTTIPNGHFPGYLATLVFGFLSFQASGQAEKDTLAHFLCVWPVADSLLHWDILRAEFSADCAHFMTEVQTSAPHENCNHRINYRHGNFMHLTAVDYGVYVFLGSDEERVRYSGILRLGEDALEDWPGELTQDSLPILHMNWTWTPSLYYSFCE